MEALPLRPSDGCPEGTFEGIETCFCKDHCSWRICRLNDPPRDCPKVMSWQWDSLGLHWVARGKNMDTLNNISIFDIKTKNSFSIRMISYIVFSGDYLKIPNKGCSSKELLATSRTTLSEAKDLCLEDSSCIYFYKSFFGGYWKCSVGSDIVDSYFTLYFKGKVL